jgi:hypothetical protein
MMNRSMISISAVITVFCALFACVSVGTKVSPKPGKWIGEGMFITEDGEERNLKILFEVNEAGNQIETGAYFLYVKGSLNQDAPTLNLWTAKSIAIENNSFHIVLYESHPLYDEISINGTFESSTLLEGEFESPEGQGRWTATQRDVP